MQEILNKAESKIKKSLSVLGEELAGVRAGRANPAVLDKVLVDYYGTPTPINQMAAVSVTEARILVISPWDVTSLREIEKAIQSSDLGINPTNDGKVIRIAFPQLTEERRKDLVKSIHKMGEEGKVAVRNIRRDALEKFKGKKKEAGVSEDEIKDHEKKIQKLTDKYCKEIDDMIADKEKEIMEI